jgi:hypothetical protein
MRMWKSKEGFVNGLGILGANINLGYIKSKGEIAKPDRGAYT